MDTSSLSNRKRFLQRLHIKVKSSFHAAKSNNAPYKIGATRHAIFVNSMLSKLRLDPAFIEKFVMGTTNFFRYDTPQDPHVYVKLPSIRTTAKAMLVTRRNKKTLRP